MQESNQSHQAASLLEKVTEAALQGRPASIEDALKIGREYPIDDICAAADRVRQARTGDKVDTCSIVNARSGRCSEDCKWCAQSRFYHTGAEEYSHIPENELKDAVDEARRRGVHRISLVCSGKRVTGKSLEDFCGQYRDIVNPSGMSACASMGLLRKDELQQLWDAGVRRYHCNIETSSDFFPTLCTTHTHDEKMATIRAAREVGMEVCSGGIIGMGETMEQRLRMVQEARDAGAVSTPVNILNPIPGTPLGETPLISEEEVILTMALMRLIAPDQTLRFAGGRARLSAQATQRCLRGGMNGALVGDMLTTVGNNIEQDRQAVASAGLHWGGTES